MALDPFPSGETLEERFWEWVDNLAPPVNATSSLWATLHHFNLALRAEKQPNVLVFHYADLKTDLSGEMQRLAEGLDISIPDRLWQTLVDAASFEQMRKRADDFVPNSTQSFWKDNRSFFHSGTGGKWRDILDESGQQRYEARVAEIASPEVSRWAHAGRS
jgi:hypothetical protein